MANHRNPLSAAAKAGDVDRVRALLQSGVSPEGVGGEPLRHAAIFGHAPVVSLLLEHGVKGADRLEEALSMAASCGHAKVVSILLSHGASPFGNTNPLIVLAAGSGYVDVVRELLAHGGWSVGAVGAALATAHRTRRQEVVEVILASAGAAGAGAVAPTLGDGGRSKTARTRGAARYERGHDCDLDALLRYAVKEGNAALVGLLLQSGADAMAPPPRGARPGAGAGVKRAGSASKASRKEGGDGGEGGEALSAREIAAKAGNGHVLAMIDAHVVNTTLARLVSVDPSESRNAVPRRLLKQGRPL